MPYDRLQRKAGRGGPATSETAPATSRSFSLPPGYRQHYGLGAPSPQSPDSTFQRAAAGSASEVPYRAEMERAFGQDFSGVRAHLGQQEAMAALGAHAATVGEQVVFAPGSPDRHLVAHELTHVVQNRQAGRQEGAVQGEGGVSDPGHPAEREAEHVAQRVVQGEAVQVTAAPAAPVQRWFGWITAIFDYCKRDQGDESDDSGEEESSEESTLLSGEEGTGEGPSTASSGEQSHGQGADKGKRPTQPDPYLQAKEAAKVKLREEADKVRALLDEANDEERGRQEWKATDYGLNRALGRVGKLHQTPFKNLKSTVQSIALDLKRLEDSEICAAIRARKQQEAQDLKEQEAAKEKAAKEAKDKARQEREDALTDECEVWITNTVQQYLQQGKYWTYTGPTIRVDKKYQAIRHRMQPRMYTVLHGAPTGYPNVTYYVTTGAGKGYGFNITGHKKDQTVFNLHIVFDV